MCHLWCVVVQCTLTPLRGGSFSLSQLIHPFLHIINGFRKFCIALDLQKSDSPCRVSYRPFIIPGSLFNFIQIPYDENQWTTVVLIVYLFILLLLYYYSHCFSAHCIVLFFFFNFTFILCFNSFCHFISLCWYLSSIFKKHARFWLWFWLYSLCSNMCE